MAGGWTISGMAKNCVSDPADSSARPINGLRARRATLSDAAAIAELYNQGIADRIATFEIAPRSAEQIAKWFTGQQLVAQSGCTRITRSACRWLANITSSQRVGLGDVD
jgi:hypothetical protein